MYHLVIIAVVATLCNTVVSRSWRGIVPPTHGHKYHNGYASDYYKHWPEWHNGPQRWDFHDHERYPQQWNDFDNSGEYWKHPSSSENWDEDNWALIHADNEFVTPRFPVSTSTPATIESTTRSVLTIVLCIRSCPVTPEYNPVCGTNNMTYNNPGKLECAKNCGVDVALSRSSPCPRITNNYNNSSNTTSAPTTTPTPDNTVNSTATSVNEIKPTRYTTIDLSPVNSGKPIYTTCETSEETREDSDNREPFAIPDDVLASIFDNKPRSSETVAPEFSFDLRLKEDRYVFS